MELIRAILRQVEARQNIDYQPVDVDGYEGWLVNRHVEMLIEAGLIDGTAFTPLSAEVPAMVRDLTWSGHDFAAVMGNDTVWSEMKQKVSASELATLPLTIVKAVGMKLLEAWFMKQTGLGGC